MRPKSAVVLYASIKQLKNEVFETMSRIIVSCYLVFVIQCLPKKVKMFICIALSPTWNKTT